MARHYEKRLLFSLNFTEFHRIFCCWYHKYLRSEAYKEIAKRNRDISPKISIRRERGVIRASMVLVVVAK